MSRLSRDVSISLYRTWGRMESREERRAVTQVHVIQLCNQSGDSNMITASNAKSGALKENI